MWIYQWSVVHLKSPRTVPSLKSAIHRYGGAFCDMNFSSYSPLCPLLCIPCMNWSLQFTARIFMHPWKIRRWVIRTVGTDESSVSFKYLIKFFFLVNFSNFGGKTSKHFICGSFLSANNVLQNRYLCNWWPWCIGLWRCSFVWIKMVRVPSGKTIPLGFVRWYQFSIERRSRKRMESCTHIGASRPTWCA